MTAPRTLAPTPGPWRVKNVQPDAWTRQVRTDESHGSVMIATTGGVDKDDNAAFIVHAVNSHAALLEACRAALNIRCVGMCNRAADPCVNCRANAMARAAIALAEGGTK